MPSPTPAPRPGPERSSSENGKVQRDLAGLLADIAAARADLARQSDLLKALHQRLDAELRPWEAKLAAARRETLRILGRHCLEGWLPRRDGQRLREALRGLADELESGFGLDLSEERRRFFAEDIAETDVENRARHDRLEALRKAIGNEEGPREAAAREKRERMDNLRKTLREGTAEDPEEGAEEADRGRDRQGNTEDTDPEMSAGKDRSGGPDGTGDGTAGRSGTGQKGRGRSKARIVREEAEDPFAGAGDIRALYVLLARALHPDKETDPARRGEKTAWMQKVTAAFAARDLAKLLDILARDPLGSVGPYLSSAPLATVKGFAKRLRRELTALREKAQAGRTGVHPSLRKFLGPQGINEAEVKRYAAELKKEVRFVKDRNEWYKERTAVEEMLKAMGADWRGYL